MVLALRWFTSKSRRQRLARLHHCITAGENTEVNCVAATDAAAVRECQVRRLGWIEAASKLLQADFPKQLDGFNRALERASIAFQEYQNLEEQVRAGIAYLKRLDHGEQP
jgi:hypothetical protein